MLETMRKASSSFFAKILLGGIALLFVLYFGFSGGGGFPQGANAPIAKVNGQSIPYGMLLELTPRNLPPQMREFQQKRELQSLIFQTLLTQGAKEIGIRVSDEELKQALITQNNFQRDGKFDREIYEQFRQNFMDRFGIDYETVLRNELISKRLQTAMTSANILSEKSIENQLQIKGIQLKLKLLQIPVTADDKGIKLEEAQELANQWIQKTQNQEDTSELLDPKNLKAIEIGPRALTTFQRSFGGAEASIPLYQCLLSLKPGETCSQSFPVQNNIIAFQLIERNQSEITEEDRQALKNQQTDSNQFQLMEGAAMVLSKRAKIINYLAQEK